MAGKANAHTHTHTHTHTQQTRTKTHKNTLREGKCICYPGDGFMIAAYIGKACEKSVFNTITRLNQTGDSHVDGPSEAMALPPIFLSLLFIFLLLYFFRANWAGEPK
jgi:hypothetical protein